MSDALSRFTVSSELPLVLTAREFRVQVLGIGETKFWALQKAGTFAGLEADLPGERFYSGLKIRRWLDAAPSTEPQLEGRHFLKAARRTRKKRQGKR